MDFNIPKIKRNEAKDNLRSVTLKGRDAQDVLDIAQRSFLDRNFRTGWEVTEVQLVENKTLEEAYRTKKNEMKDDGRHARELAEQYAYLNMKDQKISQRIAQDGLKTRELSFNSLGNSKQGIYLCKHADVQLRLFDMAGQDTCQLMVFKIVLGRSKAMSVQPTMSVDPTPNYDCHISQMKPSPTDIISVQVTRSQLYLYEYDDDTCEPVQRPRQCLPYAVITYKRSKETSQNPTTGSTSYSYNRPVKPPETKETIEVIGGRNKNDPMVMKGQKGRSLSKQERRELFERQHAEALRRQAMQETRPIESTSDPAKTYASSTAFSKTQTRQDPRMKNSDPFIPPKVASGSSQKAPASSVGHRRLSQEKQQHGMRYQQQLSVNIPRQRHMSGSTGSPSPDGDSSISDALTDLIVKNQVRVDASGRPVLPTPVRTEEEKIQSINQKFADEIQKHLQMTGVLDLPSVPKQPVQGNIEQTSEALIEDYTPQPMEIESIESTESVERVEELEFDSKISELLNQASMKPIDVTESSGAHVVNVAKPDGNTAQTEGETDPSKGDKVDSADLNNDKEVTDESRKSTVLGKKPDVVDDEDDNDDEKLVIADMDVESKKAEEVEKMRKGKESSLEKDLLTFVSRDDIKKKDTDKSESTPDESESKQSDDVPTSVNIKVVKEETMNKNEQMKRQREKILKEVQNILEKSKEKSFDSETDTKESNENEQKPENDKSQVETSSSNLPLPVPPANEYEFESRFSSDSDHDSDDGRYEQSTPMYHRPTPRPNFKEMQEKFDTRGPYDVQTSPEKLQSKSDTWVQKDLFNAYSDHNVSSGRPVPQGHHQWPQTPVSQGYPPQGQSHPHIQGHPPPNSQGHPQSHGYPPNSQGHPQHNQGHPQQSQGHPLQSQGHPPHSQGHPQQSQGHPQQSQGRPLHSQGHLPHNQGHPQQSHQVGPNAPFIRHPFNQGPQSRQPPPPNQNLPFPSHVQNPRPPGPLLRTPFEPHPYPPHSEGGGYPPSLPTQSRSDTEVMYQSQSQNRPHVADQDYRHRSAPMDFLHVQKLDHRQQALIDVNPETGDVDYRRLNPVKPPEQPPRPYLPALNIPPPMANQGHGQPGPNYQGQQNANLLSPSGAGANWGKPAMIGHTSPLKDKKISYKDYKARRKNSPIRGDGSQMLFENALHSADLDVRNLKNILETVNVVSALNKDFAEGEEPKQYIDDVAKGSSQPIVQHTGKLAFLNDVKDDEGLFNCYGGEKIPGIGDLSPQAISTEKISLSTILGTKIDMKKFEKEDDIRQTQERPDILDAQGNPIEAARNEKPEVSAKKMSPPSRGSSPRGRKKAKVKKDMMGYVKRKRRRRNKNAGDNSSDRTGETGSVTSSDIRSVDDFVKGRVMSLEEVGLNHWTDAINHPSFQPRVVLKRERAAEAGAAKIAEDGGLKSLDEALESQLDHKQTRTRQWVETSHKKIKLITLKRTKDDDTESVKSGKSSIIEDVIDIDGLVEKQIAQDLAKSDDSMSIASSEIPVIYQRPGPKCSKKMVPQSIAVLQQRKPVQTASSTVQSSSSTTQQGFITTVTSQTKPVGVNPPYPLTPSYSVPPPAVIPPYPQAGQQKGPPYPVHSAIPPPGVPGGVQGQTSPLVSSTQGQRFQYPPPSRPSFSQHLLDTLDFSKPPPSVSPSGQTPGQTVTLVPSSTPPLSAPNLQFNQRPALSSSQTMPLVTQKPQSRLPNQQIRPIVAQAAFLAGPPNRFQLYPQASEAQTVPSTGVSQGPPNTDTGNKRPSDLADWFADKLNPKSSETPTEANSCSQTDTVRPKQGTLFEELEKVKKNKLESKDPVMSQQKSRSKSRERQLKRTRKESNDIFDDSETDSKFSRSSRSPGSSWTRTPDSTRRRPYDSPVYRRRSFSPRRRRSYSRSWTRSRSRSGSRSTSISRRSRSRSRKRSRSGSRSPFRRSWSRSRSRYRRSRSLSRSRFRRSRSRTRRFRSRSRSRPWLRRTRSRSRSSSAPRQPRTRSLSKSPRRPRRRSRSRSFDRGQRNRGHSASDIKSTDPVKEQQKVTTSNLPVSSPDKKKPDSIRKISPNKKDRRTPEAYRTSSKKGSGNETPKEKKRQPNPDKSSPTEKSVPLDKTELTKNSNNNSSKPTVLASGKPTVPVSGTPTVLASDKPKPTNANAEKQLAVPKTDSKKIDESKKEGTEKTASAEKEASPEPVVRPFLKGPLQVAAESKWTKSNFTEFTVDQMKEEDLKLQEELRKLEEQKRLLEEQDQKIQEEMRMKEDKRIRDELKELELQKKIAEELLEIQKQREMAEELAELEKQKRLAEELIELERQRKIAEELVELESKNKTAEEMEELDKRKKELEDEISKPSTVDSLDNEVDMAISDELDELANQKEALQKALEALEYGDSEGLEDGEIEDDSENEEKSNQNKSKTGSLIDLTADSPKKKSRSKDERSPSTDRSSSFSHKRKRSFSDERKAESGRERRHKRSESRERGHRQRQSSAGSDNYYDDYDYGYEYSSNSREGRRSTEVGRRSIDEGIRSVDEGKKSKEEGRRSSEDSKRRHSKEIGNMWGDMISTKDKRVERVRGDPDDTVQAVQRSKPSLELEEDDDYDEDEAVRLFLHGNKPRSLAAKIRGNELITAYDLDAEAQRNLAKMKQEPITFSDWLKIEYKIDDDLEIAKYKKYIQCVDIFSRIDEYTKNRRKTLKKRLKAEMITAQVLLKKEEQEKQSKKQGADAASAEVVKENEKDASDKAQWSWEIERLSQPFTIRKPVLASELEMVRSALKMSWKEKTLNSLKGQNADGDYDNDFLMRHDLQQLEAEIIMRIGHFEFHGVPNRRIPEDLLTKREKISHFSEEGLFLVMTASISNKAYQNLLSLRKKIESLEESVNQLNPAINGHQINAHLAEIETLHQSRKAVMLTIAGYLTKKRFSKLSTRVKYYKRCIKYIQDLWKKESVYLNTTVSDAEVHLKLGERLLHEQEEAKKKGLSFIPPTFSAQLSKTNPVNQSNTGPNIPSGVKNSPSGMSNTPGDPKSTKSAPSSSATIDSSKESMDNNSIGNRKAQASAIDSTFPRTGSQGGSYKVSDGNNTPRNSASYPSSSSINDRRDSTSFTVVREQSGLTINSSDYSSGKNPRSSYGSSSVNDQRNLSSYSPSDGRDERGPNQTTREQRGSTAYLSSSTNLKDGKGLSPFQPDRGRDSSAYQPSRGRDSSPYQPGRGRDPSPYQPSRRRESSPYQPSRRRESSPYQSNRRRDSSPSQPGRGRDSSPYQPSRGKDFSPYQPSRDRDSSFQPSRGKGSSPYHPSRGRDSSPYQTSRGKDTSPYQPSREREQRGATSYSSSSGNWKEQRGSTSYSESTVRDGRNSSPYQSKETRRSPSYPSKNTSVRDDRSSSPYQSSSRGGRDQRDSALYLPKVSGTASFERNTSSTSDERGKSNVSRTVQPTPPVSDYDQPDRGDRRKVESQDKTGPFLDSSKTSVVATKTTPVGQSSRRVSISSTSSLQSTTYGPQKQSGVEKPGPLIHRQNSNDGPSSSGISSTNSACNQGQSSNASERKVQYNPSYKKVDSYAGSGQEVVKSPYTLPPPRYLQQPPQRGASGGPNEAPKEHVKSQTDKKLEADLLTVKNKLLNLSKQLRHDDSVRMSVQSVLLSVTEALNLLREESSNLPKVKEIIVECLARYNAVKELMDG